MAKKDLGIARDTDYDSPEDTPLPRSLGWGPYQVGSAADPAQRASPPPSSDSPYQTQKPGLVRHHARNPSQETALRSPPWRWGPWLLQQARMFQYSAGTRAYLLNIKELVRKHFSLGLGQDASGHQSENMLTNELSVSTYNSTTQEQKRTSSFSIACCCTGIEVLTLGHLPRWVLIPKEHSTALASHPTHLCNNVSVLQEYHSYSLANHHNVTGVFAGWGPRMDINQTIAVIASAGIAT